MDEPLPKGWQLTRHVARQQPTRCSPLEVLKHSLLCCPQAVQAAQITFEDFFLSSMDISALKIVGFEGVWGSLAMLCVMLPIVQHLPGSEGSGIHENSLDTWHVRAWQVLLCIHHEPTCPVRHTCRC